MIKIKEIAEMLSVGTSTVSAVLNDKNYCYISEEKKNLIKATAKRMGYIPNKMSRGMQGLPTNTIGIITSLFSVPITSRLIDHLSRNLAIHNYSVMFGDSYFEQKKEEYIIDEFLSRGVDGLFLQSTYNQHELDSILKGRVPYIIVNQKYDGLNVSVNRKAGAFMAVEHFIVKHKMTKVGLVISSTSSSNKEKRDGYNAAIGKYGLEPYIIEISASDESIRLAAQKAVSLNLDSVLASNDIIGCQLIKYLKHFGIQVPGDLAIIGFDGIDYICSLVEPSLTSVKQPVEDLAEKAVEFLLCRLNGEKIKVQSYEIMPFLEIGESCGCKEKGKRHE